MSKKTAVLLFLSFINITAFAKAEDSHKENPKTKKIISNQTKVKETNDQDYKYASLNLGMTHTGYFTHAEAVKTTERGVQGFETTGKASIAGNFKGGFGIGHHYKSGLYTEIEYAWHPLRINVFNYDNVYYAPTNSRTDFLFINAAKNIYHAATKYQPHALIGLGIAKTRYSFISQGNQPIATYDSDSALSMQLKIGFSKQSKKLKALSWGFDYGYVRVLGDLGLRLRTSHSSWVDFAPSYSTQFITYRAAYKF